MSLTVTTQHQPDGMRVVLPCGEITASAVPQLESFLSPTTGEPLRTLVIDFAGVTLIDSTGLSLMVRTKKSLEPRGVVFAMIHLPPAIQRVFEIVRLTPLLQVFSNQAELDRYLVAVQQRITQSPPNP